MPRTLYSGGPGARCHNESPSLSRSLQASTAAARANLRTQNPENPTKNLRTLEPRTCTDHLQFPIVEQEPDRQLGRYLCAVRHDDEDRLLATVEIEEQ